MRTVILPLMALLGGLLLFPSTTTAADLRIYEFTAGFVDCVERHEDEKHDNASAGLAESALMNGNAALRGDLKNNYWSYMNCLSDSTAGTRHRNLRTAATCPELHIELGKRTLNVPPAVDGKRIGVAGVQWVCQSGQWQRHHGDGDTPTEPEEPAACAATTIQQAQCTFNLASRGHHEGISVESESSALGDGGYSAFYQGKLRAMCVDGEFEVLEQSCQAQVCEVGQIMTWLATEDDDREGDDNAVSCFGPVEANGWVTQADEELRYYSQLGEARQKTKRRVGRAEYRCDSGRWQVELSECRLKRQQELHCDYRFDDNGNKEWACK